MLKDRKDEFYDARLVASARLHLPSVMNRQSSPLFFEAMCEIVEKRIYRGYKSMYGKDVKLSGIKDFLHNFHYGLGIREMPEFISNCVHIDLNRTPIDKNIRRFLDWLKEEDPNSFQFPPHYWELRRLQMSIFQMRGSREKKRNYFAMLKIIYNTHPEILKLIGVNRKYKSVPEAYLKEGYVNRPQKLTPIKLYSHPSYREIEELARNLNARLDKLKNRVLIAKLIEIYKINEAIETHLRRGTSPDDDDEI